MGSAQWAEGLAVLRYCSLNGASSFPTDTAGIFSVECALFLDTTGKFFHFGKINVDLKNS